MKKKRTKEYSFVYVISKITLTLNLVTFILGVTFLYQTNQLVLNEVYTPGKKILLLNLNNWIIIIGVSLTVLNLAVLISSFIYSNKNYFRFLDTLNFNTPEESLKILNNMNKIDEFGFLGTKIKELFKIYLEFSYNKKNRIMEDSKKVYFLMEEIDKPVILCEVSELKNSFEIVNVNLKALEDLKVDSKTSLLDNLEKIIHPDSLEDFRDFINFITLNEDKNRQKFYEKELFFIQSYYDKALFRARFYIFESDSYIIEDNVFKLKSKFIDSMIIVLEKD